MEYEVQPSRLPGIIDTFESWIAAENLHTVTVQYLGTGQNAPESAAEGDPYTADDVRAMASGQELMDAIVDDFYRPGKKLQARATFLGDDGKPDRQRAQRKRIPMRKARPGSVTAGPGGGGDAIKHLATAVTGATNSAVERHDKLAEARDGMAEKMMTLGQQHGEQRLADLLPLLGFAQQQQLEAQQARHDATISIWEAQNSQEQTSWAEVAHEFVANNDLSGLVQGATMLVMTFVGKLQVEAELARAELERLAPATAEAVEPVEAPAPGV
jgi:hypothetical protein